MNRAKRMFDVVAAVAGLSLVWPELLLIALAIKLEDRGPVFFQQTRVGFRGQPFQMWKFRTMVPDAERAGNLLTVAGDPRITRVGVWLRKFKLDELPQLFNVLRGEMSFTGPRPEVPKYVMMYDDQQRRVLNLVPGITDPASIAYFNEGELLAQSSDPERKYVEEIMPDKIRMNLEYADHATVWTDLKVILRTLAARPS